MALDIYVGSLTRYYAQDWETAGARAAREMGASYEVVRAQSQPAEDAVTDPAVIQEAVVGWRASLEAGLRQHLTEGLSWDEEHRHRTLPTGRPGGLCWGSVARCSCGVPGLTPT